MNWYLAVLKKYAVFSGRARRKEYWTFGLFNLLIYLVVNGVIVSLITCSSAQGSISIVAITIYPLAVLIPSLAVVVRRLHDTNHSGLWAIVPIANIVFMFIDGTRGDNQFGPDPKAGQQ